MFWRSVRALPGRLCRRLGRAREVCARVRAAASVLPGTERAQLASAHAASARGHVRARDAHGGSVPVPDLA